VPARTSGLVLRAYKIGKRYDQDISGVFVCFALERDGDRVASARIGCGGVAPVPARARATEATLAGQPWSGAAFRAAGARLGGEFAPIDDLRATAAYRRTVLANLVERLWHEVGGSTHAVRIEDVRADREAA